MDGLTVSQRRAVRPLDVRVDPDRPVLSTGRVPLSTPVTPDRPPSRVRAAQRLSVLHVVRIVVRTHGYPRLLGVLEDRRARPQSLVDAVEYVIDTLGVKGSQVRILSSRRSS